MTLTGEMLMAIVGSLATAILGLFFWFIRQYFVKGEEDTKEVKADAKALMKELAALKTTDASLEATIKALCKRSEDQIAALRELKLSLDNGFREMIREQGKLEGRLDEHISMTASYTQSIGHMSRQIDALFRFVDAPKRATER